MIALVIIGLVAALPAAASASVYLSHSTASKVTKRHARQIAAGRPSNVKATCWPTGRKHTRRNLRFRWTKWDCGWKMRVTKTDGSSGDCSGKIRVTGKRRGSKYRTIRGPRCAFVTPTPQPTPQPIPPAPGISARQQQMIDHGVSYAIGYANSLIATPFHGGSFYYGQMELTYCGWLNATKVRCPLYLWWEQKHQDPATFYTYITREIFQAFVFVEDLGTSVGFSSNIEPQGVLSFNPNHPMHFLCSTWYIDLPRCPADRFPVTYPSTGPPFPKAG
jgi:hypothetical protein